MKLVAPIIRTIIFGCISWSVLFATRLLMLPFDLSPYVWLLIQAVVSIVAGVLAGLLLRGKLYSAHLEIKSLLVTLLPYIGNRQISLRIKRPPSQRISNEMAVNIFIMV